MKLNWERRQEKEEDFTRIHFSGGAFLDEEYNIEGMTIPIDDVHTLLGRDQVQPITEAELVPAGDAEWVPPGDRIAVAQVGDKVIGVSCRMMYYRQIANLTVDEDHVAITYCPLCDAVAVFSRVVEGPQGKRVIEFGNSGALYNHNLLMYDREELGLWTQINLTAVSGENAGKQLEPRPVEVLSYEKFVERHPEGLIVNISGEPVEKDDYASFFVSDNLLVPVREFSDALPMKAPGMGIATQEQSWFVPKLHVTDTITIETDEGEVVIEALEGSFRVVSAPAGVRTLQVFFYAWSAFYPDTTIVEAP
ncbi:MAG: DUF3179 domain-containing (seleno)protein [Planctomycetota bacterium]